MLTANQPTTTVPATVTTSATCQRCKRPDRHGLARVRGLLLCGTCHLIALVRR